DDEGASDEEASSGGDLDGEALYGSAGCAACHDSGAAGAPVLGDADAWAERIEQGTDTLYESAINGKGAMPAKGGSSASDDEVKAAVDYMVEESE
ncbi:MAG: c-type cytochrome, partial [Halomonas sp.]